MLLQPVFPAFAGPAAFKDHARPGHFFFDTSVANLVPTLAGAARRIQPQIEETRAGGFSYREDQKNLQKILASATF
jgi:hypothetical protein